MTSPVPSLLKLNTNPHWAKLPLFNRKNWSRVQFDDVVENLNETCEPAEAGLERVIAMEHLEPGSLHIRAWGKVADGTTFTRRCRPGQVLFGKRRAYQRKVAVAESDAVVSGDIYVLAPKGDRLLPELLPFLCLSERFFQHAVGTSAGSLSPRTNWSSLASFEFDLPPIDQQRRIAEILWAVDEVGENAVASFNNAEGLRVAKLCELYRNGLQTGQTVATPLGARPKHWDVSPLGKHYQVQLGKMMSPKAVKGSSQRPYLRNANVQWNRLDLTQVETMSFNEREAQKFELRVGDILACEGRHVGKSAMWRNEIPGACYQKALHRIRALNGEQIPEFLLYQMEYQSLSGVFADQTGETTIPHLPAERLRAIHFVFPPKQEQLAIVAEIETILKCKTTLEGHVEASRRLLTTFVEGVVCGQSLEEL